LWLRDITLNTFRSEVIEDPFVLEKSLSAFGTWLDAERKR
jgi:hypothetical protein